MNTLYAPAPPPDLRRSTSRALARFRPADYRPLYATARAHRAELARLDHLAPRYAAEAERLAERRARLMATPVDPELLDESDADIKAVETDRQRIAEVRATLAAALPALDAAEAAALAAAHDKVAEFRVRADALRRELETEYRPLAEKLAALLRRAQQLGAEHAALAHAAGRIEVPDGAVRPTIGDAIPIATNAFLRDLDGKPLFDGRTFGRVAMQYPFRAIGPD